jgi:hypothetical protein
MERAEEVGGGHSANHQEVTASDERAIRTHEECAEAVDFVPRADRRVPLVSDA